MSNDVGAIALVLFFLVLILSFPIGLVLTFRSENKKDAKRKIDDQAWLDAELAKPRYIIEFTTTDNQVHSTGPHDPYDTDIGGTWGHRSNSKDFADRCLKGAYERGYFMDKSQNSFPTCNILTAKVVLEK